MSKLRKNIESYFADSVKGRIGLHSTRYRTMHDHDGRAWITLDRKEITNMLRIWKWLELHKIKIDKLKQLFKNKSTSKEDYQDQMAEEELKNEGIFMQSHLGEAMYEYQNLPIKDILSSKNHIIRAIGMLDRRTGKRKLKEKDISNEHPLVCTTYIFRCKAEGIKNFAQQNVSAAPQTAQAALRWTASHSTLTQLAIEHHVGKFRATRST